MTALCFCIRIIILFPFSSCTFNTKKQGVGVGVVVGVGVGVVVGTNTHRAPSLKLRCLESISFSRRSRTCLGSHMIGMSDKCRKGIKMIGGSRSTNLITYQSVSLLSHFPHPMLEEKHWQIVNKAAVGEVLPHGT